MEVFLLQVMGKDNEFEFNGHSGQLRKIPITEMQKPVEIQRLIAAGRGRQDVAAQIYAASLITIEVETPAEGEYPDQLASDLGLTPGLTQQIREFAGVQVR